MRDMSKRSRRSFPGYSTWTTRYFRSISKRRSMRGLSPMLLQDSWARWYSDCWDSAMTSLGPPEEESKISLNKSMTTRMIIRFSWQPLRIRRWSRRLSECRKTGPWYSAIRPPNKGHRAQHTSAIRWSCSQSRAVTNFLILLQPRSRRRRRGSVLRWLPLLGIICTVIPWRRRTTGFFRIRETIVYLRARL